MKIKYLNFDSEKMKKTFFRAKNQKTEYRLNNDLSVLPSQLATERLYYQSYTYYCEVVR
jgi:hypothetical protein